MSAASCLLTEEQLLCGICLDVFTNPVTLPCGHNFCKACIGQHWDTNNQYECPTCKEPFYRKLDLRVNTFISGMADQFRTSAGRRNPNQQVAKPGEVPCDICTENKMKALRSCLVCLASYCETHLKPHLTAEPLKKHQLTDPMENLEARMCKTHDKPLEIFCETHQTFVCMLCPVLDHKSCQIIPLKEQFELKTSELRKRATEIHRMIAERRRKIQEFKRLAKLSGKAAEREMADSVHVFSVLIQALERAQAELIGMIDERQKATESQTGSHIKELEAEISELTKRLAEMEQLSRSKDQLQFLQSFPSLGTSRFSTDWSAVHVEASSYEGTVKAAVEQLTETLYKDVPKLLREVKLNRLRRFAADVTLDADTAHGSLVLSDDGKRVHHSVVKKNLPDSAERFNPTCCVLGTQGFSSGRFYFEAEVKGKTRWTLGVAKASIGRKGTIPLCPDNGLWTVWLKNEEYAAMVGSTLKLSLKSKPQKVGVFVDYEESLVSFYDVDTAELLYSFTGCSFTEKLFPFFSPGLNDDGTNSTPMTICPVDAEDRVCGSTVSSALHCIHRLKTQSQQEQEQPPSTVPNQEALGSSTTTGDDTGAGGATKARSTSS